MLLEPIDDQCITLHTLTLTIWVGKIIQIYHGEVTIMTSSNIQAISIKVTKLMDNKDLHLKEFYLKVFNSNDRFYHLYQSWKTWWSSSSNTKIRLMRINRGLMLKHHKKSQIFKPLSIKSLQAHLKRKVSYLLSHNKIREAYVIFQK